VVAADIFRKLQLLNSNVDIVHDETEVPTWVRSLVGKKVNPKTELHGGEHIQEARDPFVLHRYRVSSVMVRMSRYIQIDEEG